MGQIILPKGDTIMILIDYTNYRAGQVEWAEKLHYAADHCEPYKVKEYEKGAVAAQKRVDEYFTRLVETL